MPPSLLARAATAVRSAGVGALATAVDLSVLAVLVHVTGVAPREASPLALLLGVAVQFLGNKVFAFRDRSGAWGRQALAFGAVEVVALALNLVGFEILALRLGVPVLAARIVVSAVVYGGFCLPSWSMVFRAPAALAPTPSPAGMDSR